MQARRVTSFARAPTSRYEALAQGGGNLKVAGAVPRARVLLWSVRVAAGVALGMAACAPLSAVAQDADEEEESAPDDDGPEASDDDVDPASQPSGGDEALDPGDEDEPSEGTAPLPEGGDEEQAEDAAPDEASEDDQPQDAEVEEQEDDGAPHLSRDEDDPDAIERDESDGDKPPPKDRSWLKRGMTLDHQPYRKRRHTLLSTWHGSIGGFLVPDAGSGAPGTFRVMLKAGAYEVPSWLTEDRHGHLGSIISVAYTPFPFLELYGTVGQWLDSNFSVDGSWYRSTHKSVFGAKGFASPEPWLYVGGEVFTEVPLSTVRDYGLLGQSVSMGLRANTSFDLRDLPTDAKPPVLMRLSLSYLLNNFGVPLQRLEQERFELLDDPAALGEEHRHLIDRVAQNGLRVDRTDVLSVGVGFEFPVSLARGRMVLSPIAEWVLQAPVNRQGFACPSTGELPQGQRCPPGVGAAGLRQAALAGLRYQPTYGLSAFLAAEVGLGGVQQTVAYLAPQAPYRLTFGFSYAFDVLAFKSNRR